VGSRPGARTCAACGKTWWPIAPRSPARR